MWQTIVLALALLGVGDAGKQVYTGPNALGPFRIDRDISMNSLFEKLGRPPKVARDTFCYQSKDSHAFLVLTRMVEVYDDKIAGDVILSDFRNCIDRPVQVTEEALLTWKTEDGIGLGSTAQDVLTAYGRPSREDKIEGAGYRWVVQGDYDIERNRYSTRKRAEIGDKVLVYTSPHDLLTAEFGIRNGKVVWILLSKNE
ncbi:MAG: hypothetical protein LAO31_05055 [Acidobacteriia bacterium]|nr:hypothetical protein [Terriglobia bacterium]